MDKDFINQFNQDTLNGMDNSYEELKRLLRPVLSDKIKYVNGKLMKDIFKQIEDIIGAHQYLRSNYV